MFRKLIPASTLAVAVAVSALSAAVNAGHNPYAYTEKLAKFAEIHGLEHPGAVEAAKPVDRPRLGVAIAGVSQTDLDAMSLEYGVKIERVMPGSIAAGSGLKAGDVVTAIGDRPAYSPERMRHLVDVVEGTTTIALSREGQALTLPVDFAPSTTPAADRRQPALGVRIQNMTSALKESFGAKGDHGVLIAQVNEGSAAEEAGLKAGDVVVAIGDRAVQDTADVLRTLAAHSAGDEIEVTFLRDRAETALTVKLGEASKAMFQNIGDDWHGPGHMGQGGEGHGHPLHGQHGLRSGSWHDYHPMSPS